MEGGGCVTLGLRCIMFSDDLVRASRAVPMSSLVSSRPFAQGSLVSPRLSSTL